MTTPELKPCPMCGSVAILKMLDANYSDCFVLCCYEGCGIRTPQLTNSKLAVMFWNRRAVPCHQCVSLREDFEKKYDELIKSWTLSMSDKVKE